MNNLTELQRRKALLAGQIARQQEDLKKTFVEIRDELEPGNLLKKAVTGALGLTTTASTEDKPGMWGKLPGLLAFVADILVKDKKWAILFKILAPAAAKFLPLLDKKPAAAPTPVQPAIAESTELPDQVAELEEKPEIPVKAKIYGQIRRSVADLRSKLRKQDNTPEAPLDTPEN